MWQSIVRFVLIIFVGEDWKIKYEREKRRWDREKLRWDKQREEIELRAKAELERKLALEVSKIKREIGERLGHTKESQAATKARLLSMADKLKVKLK